MAPWEEHPAAATPTKGCFGWPRYDGRCYTGRERRARPAGCSAGRSRAGSGVFCGPKVSYSLHSLQLVKNYQPPWLGERQISVLAYFHAPRSSVLDFWSNRPALFGHFQSGDGGCVELSSLNSPFPGHEERESLNSYCQRVYLHRVGVAQRGRTGPKMDENGGPTG